MHYLKRTVAVIAVMALFIAYWSAPVLAATTTKTFSNKQFSFSYPNTLVKSKASCGSSGCYIELSPTKKKAGEYLKKGAAYQLRVARLGTKADPLTGDEENALEDKDWTGFINAVLEELRGTLSPSSLSSKSYKKSGFTATKVSATAEQQGAKIVVNVVIMTKNKTTAYMVQELWVYTGSTMSKNPFAKNFTAFVKSFKLLK
ncbi:MAG: hypothetical protein HY567_01360 [Candidatus Kerfeldbacteria bacterium]|nr:hypothetical protein [Candidatus Kerfeldbacteria bacterium]